MHILPNGLCIIHESPLSKMVYYKFAVGVGIRNEVENEQGMARFAEHLIFKGTWKREAWHILNRVRNVGGDPNAYTNREETVVYSAFLIGHFGRALESLAGIAPHFTSPQNEIEEETEVIIDKIQSYKDTPSELIFGDSENMIFRNHSSGRDILGRPGLLKQLRSGDAVAFTSWFYQPSNMIFFVLGSFNFQEIVRQVEKLLADLPLIGANNHRIPPPLYVPEHLVVHKETYQAHVTIDSRGYDTHGDKRIGSYLPNNTLGGSGMNSRLNVSLRERRELVYTVESNLIPHTDTGVFCVYFGADPADADTCLRLTYRELKRMRDMKVTSSQLMAAKEQLIGQIGAALGNNESNALGMVKTFLHYHRYESSESVPQRIKVLAAEGLSEMANEIFTEEYLSTLIYR